MRGDDEPLSAGATIGRYRVLRKLGAGGMGVVYVAHDPSLERDVAIKVLPAALTDDPERRQRFMREARSAAKVQHRAIATIHEVSEEKGQVFLAMELINGVPLDERIAEGPMSPQQVAGLGAEIARGLARAHEAGIVHRDLKPGNIMLDADGQPKLLDFGLSKQLDTDEATEQDETVSALTGAGRILGTPGYMAPEQAAGKEVDERVDLFALGTVLYELLTGRMAFGGDSTAERIAATLKDEPTRVGELATDVPPGFALLIESCLQKDPNDRPASAAEVAAALEQLRGAASSARGEVAAATTKVRPGAPSSGGIERRWPLWLALGLAVLAGAVYLVRTRWSAADNSAPAANEPSAAELLAASDAVVACPVFEVQGVEGKGGRLGAATAVMVCDAAALWLGGADQQTRSPAALLGLPKLATEDFVDAPYLAEDVRERTLVAAAAHTVVADGKLAVHEDDFELELKLTTPDGRTLATARSRGVSPKVIANRGAAKLLEAAAVPPRAFDEELRGAFPTPDGRAAVLAQDLAATIAAKRDVAESCAALAKLMPVLAASHADRCGHPERTDEGLPRWPPSLAAELAKPPPRGRLAWSFLLRRPMTPALAQQHLKQVAEQRVASRYPLAEAHALTAEALARLWTGDAVGARTVHDQALELVPRWCSTRMLFPYLASGPSLQTLARAAVAWCPDTPEAWMQRGRLDTRRELSVGYQQVAFLLSARQAVFGLNYAHALLYQGRPEEVRNLASRYLGSDDATDRLTGEYLQVRFDYSRGRLAAARDRCRKNLLAAEVSEATQTAYIAMLVTVTEVESLLGQHEVVDAALDRLVRDGAAPNEWLSPLVIGFVASYASPEVGKRSMSRLQELIDEGKVVMAKPTYIAAQNGAVHYVAGNHDQAAKAWRPLVATSTDEGRPAPEAFDRAGDAEAASALDRKTIEWFGAVVTLADVREARRAATRGDDAEAKRLAKRVVDAWATADVEVPAVAEIREILRR